MLFFIDLNYGQQIECGFVQNDALNYIHQIDNSYQNEWKIGYEYCVNSCNSIGMPITVINEM